VVYKENFIKQNIKMRNHKESIDKFLEH
jgi:hypothetical protein